MQKPTTNVSQNNLSVIHVANYRPFLGEPGSCSRENLLVITGRGFYIHRQNAFLMIETQY